MNRQESKRQSWNVLNVLKVLKWIESLESLESVKSLENVLISLERSIKGFGKKKMFH